MGTVYLTDALEDMLLHEQKYYIQRSLKIKSLSETIEYLIENGN